MLFTRMLNFFILPCFKNTYNDWKVYDLPEKGGCLLFIPLTVTHGDVTPEASNFSSLTVEMLSTDILHTMLSVCMISVVNKYTFWASNRNCETLPQLVNVHDLSHAFSDGNNKKLCVRKTLQRKKQSSTLKWKPFCKHNSDKHYRRSSPSFSPFDVVWL